MVQFPELEIPENVSGAVYAATGIVVAAIVLSRLTKRSRLDVIPTIGSSGWLGSWWACYNYSSNATQVVQEGYEKYKHKPFKVADINRWVVVVSDREHMEELRKAPDEVLSFDEAIDQEFQFKYIMGIEVLNNTYHVNVVRSQLTRSIGTSYTEIRDEIVTSFDDVLDLKDHEWKSVPALLAIQQVVCRTSNRFFVGLPLCRDPDWIKLNLKYTLDVIDGARAIKRWPSFFAPLVVYFMTDIPGSTRRAMEHLQPIIEERLKQMEQYGDNWPNKPNDLLSWLLEYASEGPDRSVKSLTIRVLLVNFVAIHTSSNSFCLALFFLAANPQYAQSLREEVESIVEKEGWTKASLRKMCKVDSFLRESQRIEGIASLSLMRKVLRDFTFSDGTFLPKGTFVVSPARSLHLDEDMYENATVFDPFRFSNMRDNNGEGTKHQFVSTSLDYLPFGHGKHACPGRFFAANELKSMLAHIVLTYDIRLEDGEPLPQPIQIGAGVIANPFAKVMFRKRVN